MAAGLEGVTSAGKHIGSSVKKGLDTYKGLNGEQYPELTDEDIAQDLATKDFENWKADNPDSAVASRLKQAFPVHLMQRLQKVAKQIAIKCLISKISENKIYKI